MIPTPDFGVLHYEGLKQVGAEVFCKCERCGKWRQCGGYQAQFVEGLQRHVRRVCKGCLEVEQ